MGIAVYLDYRPEVEAATEFRDEKEIELVSDGNKRSREHIRTSVEGEVPEGRHIDAKSFRKG